MAIMARPTATAAAQGWGPASVTITRPTTAESRWPPTNARGCAGFASGEPITITIEVANGMNSSRNAVRYREDFHGGDRHRPARGAGQDGDPRPFVFHCAVLRRGVCADD